MDNKTSGELEKAFTQNEIKYQYVPPGNHRANAAERAIQTFKSHFKAGLASTDSNYPVHKWNLLLDQAELTLNLLRAMLLIYKFIKANLKDP